MQDGIGWEGNLWIAKPSAMSRGRGIQVFGDVGSLLDHVGLTAPVSAAPLGGGGGVGATASVASQLSSTSLPCIGAAKQSAEGWIVQKYIERPLLIAERKFDLRQWVLVTSINPLVIWFYDECYCRVAVEKWSNVRTKESLEDRFAHLVNQSVSKYHQDYDEDLSFVAENGRSVVQGMWPQSEFASWLEHVHGDKEAAGKGGERVFRERIQPQLHKAAIATLLAAQPRLEERSQSYEIFGFDFMIDANLNVWVIEVNASPATDFSTAVTARYVPAAVTSSFKVVMDHADWSKAPKNERGAEPDTGAWVRIHNGATASRPAAALSMKLEVAGVGMRPPDAQLSPDKLAKKQRKKQRKRQLAAQQKTAQAVAQHLARQAKALNNEKKQQSLGGAGRDYPLPVAIAGSQQQSDESLHAPRRPLFPRPTGLPRHARSLDANEPRSDAARIRQLGRRFERSPAVVAAPVQSPSDVEPSTVATGKDEPVRQADVDPQGVASACTDGDEEDKPSTSEKRRRDLVRLELALLRKQEVLRKRSEAATCRDTAKRKTVAAVSVAVITTPESGLESSADSGMPLPPPAIAAPSVRVLEPVRREEGGQDTTTAAGRSGASSARIWAPSKNRAEDKTRKPSSAVLFQHQHEAARGLRQEARQQELLLHKMLGTRRDKLDVDAPPSRMECGAWVASSSTDGMHRKHTSEGSGSTPGLQPVNGFSALSARHHSAATVRRESLPAPVRVRTWKQRMVQPLTGHTGRESGSFSIGVLMQQRSASAGK